MLFFTDLSKEESPWKSIKGSFMNVGLFCIPGNCEMAPEGLSKFSHLNDGVLHLVLVKDAPRKDFIRYLRRHGNHKNQVNHKKYVATRGINYLNNIL